MHNSPIIHLFVPQKQVGDPLVPLLFVIYLFLPLKSHLQFGKKRWPKNGVILHDALTMVNRVVYDLD